MRKYDLSINNNSYEVVVKKVTESEALVEVNGQEHTVSINQIESLILPETIPKAAPEQKPGIKQAPNSVQTTAASGDNIIAPMPGQIKAILVREGDMVKAGQKLLIMEAMKLENKLPAPRDGKVKHILVRDGDIVSQGQELIVIK
ncbi:MAG: biotin/lipoyl-binding protein [Deltaproteobacteria bacterium]|jgi:biotin carboxyl carrier protein|nr:biotin/lipoyl-binding protein [Deltaproteobacteria bacterium]